MKRGRSHSPRGEENPPVAPPNFERSGLLAKESNNVNGVALKYHEPPEAKKPRHTWRLYVFKDGKEIGMWIFWLKYTRHVCARASVMLSFWP